MRGIYLISNWHVWRRQDRPWVLFNQYFFFFFKKYQSLFSLQLQRIGFLYCLICQFCFERFCRFVCYFVKKRAPWYLQVEVFNSILKYHDFSVLNWSRVTVLLTVLLNNWLILNYSNGDEVAWFKRMTMEVAQVKIQWTRKTSFSRGRDSSRRTRVKICS